MVYRFVDYISHIVCQITACGRDASSPLPVQVAVSVVGLPLIPNLLVVPLFGIASEAIDEPGEPRSSQ